MCGRYSLFDTDALYERFNVAGPPIPLSPQYNVTPGSDMPVITNDGKNRLRLMHWGLIPRWSKTASHLLINARAETAAAKPTFRSAFLSRRCLVPANGYFEWQKISNSKQPYFFHFPNNLLFAFVGLYDDAQNSAADEPANTYTILTTDAPATVSYIHPRIPVILNRDQEKFWLDSDQADPDQLTSFLTTLTVPQLQAHPVSPQVNKPTHNYPSLINPIKLPSDQ